MIGYYSTYTSFCLKESLCASIFFSQASQWLRILNPRILTQPSSGRKHIRVATRLDCSKGSRDGAVVRALAPTNVARVRFPDPGVICGLSLLALYSVPRGFSPGTPVFPSPQKPTSDLI